jgi:hypothetical protein
LALRRAGAVIKILWLGIQALPNSRSVVGRIVLAGSDAERRDGAKTALAQAAADSSGETGP